MRAIRQHPRPWVPITETYLGNATYDINVVVWSWCGGASDNTEEGINIYLNAMNELELEYPDVIFVYMTGHLDGTGDGGNLRARNNQIRAYCEANGKVLFDFADIESWDPAGAYDPDESDGCAWCSVWCSTLAHPARVTLEVLDLTGRVVVVLEDGPRAAGDHAVVWNGSSDDGRRSASGTYFYRLRTDGAAETRKMILLK